jgi:hypothetical protein
MTTSSIWKYFTIKENNPSKAICNACKSEISRGSAVAKSQTTSAMRKHLNGRHKELFLEMERSDSESKNVVQPTLHEYIQQKSEWNIDSEKARRVHEAIGTMMAKDFQPFSIVEDKGFINLISILQPR